MFLIKKKKKAQRAQNERGIRRKPPEEATQSIEFLNSKNSRLGACIFGFLNTLSQTFTNLKTPLFLSSVTHKSNPIHTYIHTHTHLRISAIQKHKKQ